jgi:hypothetical protein
MEKLSLMRLDYNTRDEILREKYIHVTRGIGAYNILGKLMSYSIQIILGKLAKLGGLSSYTNNYGDNL